MRETMFFHTRNQLTPAEILPGYHYHKDGAKVVRALLEDGFISQKTYDDLVGTVIGNKLLETNVFAFRFSSQEITFQSTAVRRFCEENSYLWEEK